jgi:hypothetical protein
VQACASLWGAATPLFEKEGDILCYALIAHIESPSWVHKSGVRAALPADNDPMDAFKIKFPDRRY